MSEENLLSEESKPKVDVLDRLDPGDLDHYPTIAAAQDRSHKVRSIVRTWEQQQDQERPLRTLFAWALFTLVAVQVIALFVFAFFLGFGLIHVEQWVATTFLIGVLTQTIALVHIVTKYLFPEKSQQILEIIEKL